MTFVASTSDSEHSVEMRYEDENIWLTQKMMAKSTRRYFAAVQNKMHFSTHGQTAAEVIYNRAFCYSENSVYFSAVKY